MQWAWCSSSNAPRVFVWVIGRSGDGWWVKDVDTSKYARMRKSLASFVSGGMQPYSLGLKVVIWDWE
jgi:hypothetical protein